MGFLKVISQELSMAFLIYIITTTIISIVGFCMMAYDKYRAVKGQFRISELTFMAIAFFGGASGILLGMVCFHHKVSKKKFNIGVPVLYLFNQLFLIVIFYRTLNV